MVPSAGSVRPARRPNLVTTGPMPGWSLGSITAAPAPSAKRKAVERSCLLVMSLSRSTPMIKTYFEAPVRTNESAIAVP